MMDVFGNSEGIPCHQPIGRECRGSKLCRVPGCSVELQSLSKPYCLKKRLCPAHMTADAVKCEGSGEQLYRYCQQCGKLEPLAKFQGARRSCRTSLIRRRAQGDDHIAQQKRCRHQHQQRRAVEQHHTASTARSNSSSAFKASGDGLDTHNDDSTSHYLASLIAEACAPTPVSYTAGHDMQVAQPALAATDSNTDTEGSYLDMLVQQEINKVLAAAAAAGVGVAAGSIASTKQAELELEQIIEDELRAAAAMVGAAAVDAHFARPPQLLQNAQAVQFRQLAQRAQQPLQQQAMAYFSTAAAPNNTPAAVAAAAPTAKLEACSAASHHALHPAVHIDAPAESAAWIAIRLQTLRAQMERLQQMAVSLDVRQQLQRVHSSTASVGAWQLL